MAPGRNKLIQFLVLFLIYRIGTFCLAQETECKNGACRFKTLLLPAEKDQEMKELPVEKAWETCAPSIPFNLTANSFMDCNSAECYFQKKNILKEDGTLNEGALDSYKELPMVNVLKQMCMDTWVPNGLIRKRREERQKRRLLAGTISNSIVDGIPIRHMKNFDSDIWFARQGRSAEEMSRRKRQIHIGEGGSVNVDGKKYDNVKNMKIEGDNRVTFGDNRRPQLPSFIDKNWRPQLPSFIDKNWRPQLPSFLQIDKNWQWGEKRSAESNDDESVEMNRLKRKITGDHFSNNYFETENKDGTTDLEYKEYGVPADHEDRYQEMNRFKRKIKSAFFADNNFKTVNKDGTIDLEHKAFGVPAGHQDRYQEMNRIKRKITGDHFSNNYFETENKDGTTDLEYKEYGVPADHEDRYQIGRKREINIKSGENISVDDKKYAKVENMKIDGDNRVTFGDNGYGRYARSADDETLGLAACLDESVEIALSMCAMDKLY